MHRDYQVGDGMSAGTEELAKNVAAVTYGGGSPRFARIYASNLTLRHSYLHDSRRRYRKCHSPARFGWCAAC